MSFFRPFIFFSFLLEVGYKPYKFGQIAQLEVLGFRFFVFSSFHLFFLFPEGYKLGQMAHLEALSCYLFFFLSFFFFSG